MRHTSMDHMTSSMNKTTQEEQIQMWGEGIQEELINGTLCATDLLKTGNMLPDEIRLLGKLA